MTAQLSVGVALSARPWRGALQRHCRDHVADLVLHLVHDGRQAFDLDVDVVLVDDETSWLSAPFVNQARDRSVAVIGVFDHEDGEGHGQRLLQRLGVSCQLRADSDAEELVEAVLANRPDPDVGGRFASVTNHLTNRRPMSDRHTIAVGGPAGAGATEVAVAVCQTLRRGEGRPLLIDVDETHPSLARRLGLSLHPHLLTAIDLTRGEESSFTGLADSEPPAPASLADCLALSAVGAKPLPFDVIVGLASRDDWTLARADDVGEVLEELAAQWPTVVVRLGPQLEDLSRHVDRYELSRVAAARADRVVAVCDGSATGLLRFVDWLIDVLSLIGDTPLDVVVNRATTPTTQNQLVDQLRHIAGDRVGQIVVASSDRRVERAAWDATLVARGPFRRAIEQLVAA